MAGMTEAFQMQGSPTMLLLRALCAETKSMKVHDSFHIYFTIHFHIYFYIHMVSVLVFSY